MELEEVSQMRVRWRAIGCNRQGQMLVTSGGASRGQSWVSPPAAAIGKPVVGPDSRTFLRAWTPASRSSLLLSVAILVRVLVLGLA